MELFNRRETLRVLAGTTAAFYLGGGLPARAQLKAPRFLSPEQEEGPYYISAEHIRRDIREARPGVPLELHLYLVDAAGKPVRRAAIDIWHCDAAGIYSGFAKMKPMGPPPNFAAHHHHPPGPPPHHAPTDASTFLRGVQLTDDKGSVRFSTIYPGWYMGREIHIHLKVHVHGQVANGIYTGGNVCHTGQLFFPDRANEIVSRLAPYANSTTPRTTKVTDGVYRHQHGEKSILSLSAKAKDPAAGFLGVITVAVNPAAKPRPVERPSSV